MAKRAVKKQSKTKAANKTAETKTELGTEAAAQTSVPQVMLTSEYHVGLSETPQTAAPDNQLRRLVLMLAGLTVIGGLIIWLSAS